MHALFWFNCLAVLGLGLTIFTIYKKRYLTEFSTWLVFFLFATSITWLGEFVVLGLLNSYAYKPDVFENPWAENLVGHLILNSTLWPGSAILVAGYRLGYSWILIISGIFLSFEYLFIRAGLYEQHWWRYYMTAVAIILYLVFLRIWFPLMNTKRHGLVRFVSLYFAAFVVIHLPIPLMLLYGKQYYSANLTQDWYRSSIIFILFYQMAETLIVMALFSLKSWLWNLVPYLLSFSGQLFLANKNILILQDGWTLINILTVYAITLTICLLLEKYTLHFSSYGKWAK